NGKFVAVAYSSNIAAYSEDGINWTQSTLPASSSWQSVTYGNGKFVAVAYSSNIAAYSEYGINWTQSTLPASAKWYSATYGNGKFVAVASSNIAAYSEDGINWTQSTLPASAKWYSATYGNGKFVAVSSGNIAAYSTDGINWTQSTLPASVSWRSVTYGNGKFVAVTYNSNIAAYSITINFIESLTDFGYSKIEVGSYVGTGTYGSSNPNTLTFGFEPKLVLIGEVSWKYFTVLFNGIGIVMTGGSNRKMTSTSFSGKTVSWYNIDGYTGSTESRVQMNESGVVYHYIAIG
ncbi:MAG: hypothetical protein ACI3VT_01140, partial [Evtepia sp.]